MKRNYIRQVFTDLKKLKTRGIHFSGIRGEGEYKLWYSNGRLYIHCFFKNSKKDGEYKEWNVNGQLAIHKLYKNDKIVKDYLE